MIDSWQDVGVCCVVTAVVSLVGVVCFIVIGSSSEGEVEGASWVLWLDGASDGEVGEAEDLLLDPQDPVDGGGHRDVGLRQQVCKHRR